MEGPKVKLVVFNRREVPTTPSGKEQGENSTNSGYLMTVIFLNGLKTDENVHCEMLDSATTRSVGGIQERKVKLLRKSHSMRMETVYFTLHATGVMQPRHCWQYEEAWVEYSYICPRNCLLQCPIRRHLQLLWRHQ